MKLKVPFYLQTSPLNCGPAALRMVLAYLGKEIEILEQQTGIKDGKGISTVQIATAAALSGFKTELFSEHITFNDKNLKLEFYQKYADLAAQSKKLIEDAEKVGVILKQEILTLNNLLKKVTEKCVPIILLDWNVIKGTREKGYQGHFVPIVGCDAQNVYVHNHGFLNPTAFLPIKKEIFDEARKSPGTDQDIIFIHKKSQNLLDD